VPPDKTSPFQSVQSKTGFADEWYVSPMCYISFCPVNLFTNYSIYYGNKIPNAMECTWHELMVAYDCSISTATNQCMITQQRGYATLLVVLCTGVPKSPCPISSPCLPNSWEVAEIQVFQCTYWYMGIPNPQELCICESQGLGLWNTYTSTHWDALE
jgi:hypothetical protein